MNILNGKVIQPHTTWSIHDASKISCFISCPRRYFYRYVLGWENADPNVHLVFGEAWHKAMEILLQKGYNAEGIAEGYTKAEEHYRQYFPEISDDIRYPKTPVSILASLQSYAAYYVHDNFKVYYTEIAGTVPLTEDGSMKVSFRLDGICEDNNGIWCIEHKTGSRLDSSWEWKWALSMQIGVYTHVLHMLFDPSLVYGVRINGAIFKKSGTEFIRVPIRKTPTAVNDWYWNVVHWMEMIKWEFERLQECKDSDTVMRCFPKANIDACTQYFGCKYRDFCISWQNPLQKIGIIPVGFKEEWWNPTDREKDASKVFHFGEKEGGTDE